MTFSKWTIIIDRLAIFSVTLMPFLFYCASYPDRGWFNIGQVIHLPNYLAVYFLIIGGIGLLIFMSHQIFLFKTYNYIFPTKIIIILSSLVVWGFSFISDFPTEITTAIFIAHHGIPYLYFTFRYVKLSTIPKVNYSRAGWCLSLFVVIALAVIQFSYNQQFDWYNSFASKASFFKSEILVKFLVNFTLVHYAVDFFFWKKRYNPKVADIF